MTTCPACSCSVTPNDQTCPQCRITLYHEQAGGGQSAALGGSSLFVAVGVGLAAIVGLLLCAGVFSARWFVSSFPAPVGAGSSMIIIDPSGSMVEVETPTAPEGPETPEGAADPNKPADK